MLVEWVDRFKKKKKKASSLIPPETETQTRLHPRNYDVGSFVFRSDV